MNNRLVLFVVVISFYVNGFIHAQTQTNLEIKQQIYLIEKNVVDLTNPLEPLHCQEFLKLRDALTTNDAVEIVRLIQNNLLNDTQTQIGLLLMSKLPENIYWDVSAPLLFSKLPDSVLGTVLLQALPYGPCYANAYTNDIIRKKLLALNGKKSLGNETRNRIDLILSGKAAKTYRDYLKHPNRYGY